MTPLGHYLTVGSILFAIGLVGVLTRRNLIIMFLSIETMLQGVAINFVAFSMRHGNLAGQAMVLFIVAVAACEAALALAIILMLYKRRHTLDSSVWQELREEDVEETVDEETLPAASPPAEMPHLTPAGLQPAQRTEETSNV